MKRGQIGLLPLFGVGATILIASISAFFSQSNRIGGIETKAAVLETRYEEVDRKLERIEDKLDTIISDRYLLSGRPTSTKINGHQ